MRAVWGVHWKHMFLGKTALRVRCSWIHFRSHVTVLRLAELNVTEWVQYWHSGGSNEGSTFVWPHRTSITLKSPRLNTVEHVTVQRRFAIMGVPGSEPFGLRRDAFRSLYEWCYARGRTERRAVHVRGPVSVSRRNTNESIIHNFTQTHIL